MQTNPSSPRFKVLRNLLILVTLGAGLTVGLPILAFVALIVQDSWSEWQRCRGYTQFNPEVWQDPSLTVEPRYVRSCMVDDLLASGRLTSQPQTELVRLLGEPTTQNGFTAYDLVYWLGPERSLISIDSEWLVITLDASGKVAEAQLVTD